MFFFFWLLQLFSSVAYLLTVFRTVMYFVGLSSYLCAMGNDLRLAIDDIDKIICDPSLDQSAHAKLKKALINEIQFHNEIIE